MKGTENNDTQSRDGALEELFRHATARERPPAATESDIREALHTQWQEKIRRRRTRRRWLGLATAASIALAAVLVTYMQSPGESAPVSRVAGVAVVKGTVYLRRVDDDPWVELDTKAGLETGQELSTAFGAGLSLRWHGGAVLRVDQNSRIRLTSAGSVGLQAGRIYVDTGDVTASAPVLTTPAGPVRHVGTRYMVTVNAGSTSVSVREGNVLFGDKRTLASGGEKLVSGRDGQQRRERIPVYGEYWSWADNLAEPQSPGGRSVAALLDWIGRETGRPVEYASPQAERLARESVLHGDVGLEPYQVLELIGQSTDLAPEVSAGKIMIDTKPSL